MTHLTYDVSGVDVPGSEMQEFYQTLRDNYWNEDTAKDIEDRDRSDTMPPRTLADATMQLSGWLAQVAQSNNTLELEDDTMRRADSGKQDDGGRVEVEALETLYVNDGSLRGSAGEDEIVVSGANDAAQNALQDRLRSIRDELLSPQPYIAFGKNFVIGFFKDGLWGAVGDVYSIGESLYDNVLVGVLAAPFRVYYSGWRGAGNHYLEATEDLINNSMNFIRSSKDAAVKG